MYHPADRIIARALFTQPDVAVLDAYRSDVQAGLWNRWYDGEEPTMWRTPARVRGCRSARAAHRIAEEYSV